MKSLLSNDLSIYKKLCITIENKTIDIYSEINPSGAKVSHILYKHFPRAVVGGKYYFRLYRRFKFLEKAGLVKLDHGVSGYVEYEKSGLYAVPTGKLVYLIEQVQNSNHGDQSAKHNIPRMYRIPQKCRPERIEAIKTMLQINRHDLFVKDDPKNPQCPIQPELRNLLREIELFFKDYKIEVGERRILLRHKDDPEKILKIPFLHRFNDPARKIRNLKTFESAWRKTVNRYKNAVFLTLTTDPAPGPTLWHRNRHMGKAWNRYQSLLKKRFGQRHKYICVNEFQKNGLIHCHVVIFGIRWLNWTNEIERDWDRCGQGKIAHVYGIKNNGNDWEWVREKPTDANGRSPGEYLKKYVKKGLFEEEGYSLYWAVNKRFFSMSRVFQDPSVPMVNFSLWIFLGSWKEEEIPDWIYQQNRGRARGNYDGWPISRSQPGEPAAVW